MKIFYCWEDTVRRMKGQTIGLKKMFAKHISDKELPVRIHYELLKLNQKRNSLIKMGKKFDKVLHQRGYPNCQHTYEKVLKHIRATTQKFKMKP